VGASVWRHRRRRLVIAILRQQSLPPPNVDFALATSTHAFGLRPGAGEELFTAVRLVGWLAHAMEEYVGRLDFRIRSMYISPRPDAG
jgi:citrate synthase